jgi:hypothetical protein
MPQIFPYWEHWHVYLSRVHKTYTAVKQNLCNKGENLNIISNSHTQKLRVVIGLLTRHNTLRRHLHIMGLSNNPICRKCGTEEETSVQILCECEALASLSNTYLGSFFFDP